MRVYALLPALLLIAALPTSVPDGRAVVNAMHARHADSWPVTATWDADLTIVGAPSQTRRHLLRAPDRLRVDVDAGFADVTVLFRRDSVYQWINGRARGGRPFPQEGLLLSHGVYTQPPATTIAKLESWGFDLDLTHEAEWDGRPALVVGAKEGDDTSSQFWVDRETLLLVRLIHPDRDQASIVSDTRFDGYERVGGAWVATRMTTLANGASSVDQVIRNFKPGVDLGVEAFDPDAFQPEA